MGLGIINRLHYYYMCGIVGYYSPDGVADKKIVEAMNERILHRGPDEDGYFVEGGLGIGMRRLSIIDLAGGTQPISNEDGSALIVFNGEIYNFQQLRLELESLGHRFKTHTDTEVILHLWEDGREKALEKLRGMFALAIWDRKAERLFLARDRFGKKPLYYALHQGQLYFGSELKCFRGLGLPLKVDREALKLYFRFRYIPEPRSIFEGIRKLPAAGWLDYGKDGTLRQGIYWKLPPQKVRDDGALDRSKARERLRELFDESVKLRMAADVPLGAFLSAGVDSGSVVASMAKQATKPVQTFSIGFAGESDNETEGARRQANKSGAEHHEIEVRPNSVELIGKLASFLDEPFGDSSAIPTYIVSEYARKHVKVVLSGDGGDELFQGYDSFFRVNQLRNWDKVPGWTRKLIGIAGSLAPYSAPGKNFARMVSRSTPIERYMELNHVPFELRQRLLKPDWRNESEGEVELRRQFQSCLLEPGSDILAEVVEFEATAKLAGDMLVKVDRMSMANSIEVRCPLLDHKLAEFARQIPAEWNMSNGKGKAFFLEALGDRLASENLSMPKRGFGVPLAKWFRQDARELLSDILLSERFALRGVCEPAFVAYLLEEHQTGRRDNYHLLWMLLMLELWFRSWETEAGFRL